MNNIIGKEIMAKIDGVNVTVYGTRYKSNISIFYKKNTARHSFYATDDNGNTLKLQNNVWIPYNNDVNHDADYIFNGVMVDNEFYCTNIIKHRQEYGVNASCKHTYLALAEFDKIHTCPFIEIKNKECLSKFLKRYSECKVFIIDGVEYDRDCLF
ncbi:hypothetical protein CONCODRAFT_167581 [Conidiobolus coronatus NRRL 28638]|uniref:Uncharacterized protein n=1 Tax=Conidiobolus coronatus (strain ATCC 28846 / CBS 209.66 / NRRL 28638) TaxID=796925 RepID=A0A137PE00_CONC2|nr:hypothetical protein CONCODRAFT_167581 [Conidiobolus coronatus NRRL 28638]|eukprot:KXN73234.1 hypothetical protein CONCODRAFT_167581 [Conidiobolus coronatus NRRL 28638]